MNVESTKSEPKWKQDRAHGRPVDSLIITHGGIELHAEGDVSGNGSVEFDGHQSQCCRDAVGQDSQAAWTAVVGGVDVIRIDAGFRGVTGSGSIDQTHQDDYGLEDRSNSHAVLSTGGRPPLRPSPQDSTQPSNPMSADSDPLSEATPPRFPFVSVDVNPDEAEDAGALLFELGATGVEQRDATTLVRGRDGKVTLVASFDNDGDARGTLSELPATWSPRVTEVVGDGWRDEWKKHFEPFPLGGGLVVRPPWRSYHPEPGEHVLLLEPGRAFGTGLHETTSLTAALLTEFFELYRMKSVLDVGCGSGILGLVALVRGAARVRAVDIDPEAVAVTRENAARNGMAERVEVDTTPVHDLAELYPAIVANIEAATLVQLAPPLVARLAPGGLLVLSGILAPEVSAGQIESVRHAYGALAEHEVRRKGDWLAVALRG